MKDSIYRYLQLTVWIGCMLSASASLHSQPGQPRAVNADACNNYLYIKGESNINEFTFYYNSIPLNLIELDNSGDTINLSIPVKEFEASNSFMYKDFLELMKEEKHPRILISFSRRQIEKTITNTEACPELIITIAGVKRKYKVDCHVLECSGNYYMKGREIILLSDFNLKPPARLMGMVKVNNKINVDFGFIVTFANNNNFSVKL